MKRFVGPALVVIALLLGCTWVFPESEPELGMAALLVILEMLGAGVALSVNTFDTRP